MESTNSNNVISIYPISGTRDFKPDDLRKREWLFAIWKRISLQYGFEGVDAPILESKNLYSRKGSDDLLEEMFRLKTGNEDLVLRPEFTPTVCRLVMQILPKSPKVPLKFFNERVECWRNETTSLGRKRNFIQWNADVFAGPGVKYELELFQMIITFFKEVKLKPDDIIIKVSNRMILQKVLQSLKVPDELFEQSCIIIDKIKKLSDEDFEMKLNGIGVYDVNRIRKLTTITSVDQLTEFLQPNDDTLKEITELFRLAKELGIDEWLKFDASIVRGLSYYTGLVFEGFALSTMCKRAVCGGGRYDNLLQTYGYKEKVPAVGFGFGDVVIMEVLEELKLLPDFSQKVDYVVVPFNDSLYVPSVKISEALRSKGKTVITYNNKGKRTKAFDFANKTGAELVVYVAPDEWSKEEIVVKRLRETDLDKKQFTVKLNDYIDSL